jgi:hypothetical protein
MQELRVTLNALGQKMDAVLMNQVKLDELMRKVGLATEREARAVEKALGTLLDIEKTAAGLVLNVDALDQVMAGVKSDVGERLNEVVNQVVASQQDIIGWLRRVSDKTGAGRQGNEATSLTEEVRRFSITEKVVAEDLRQVIQMLVAGETVKAVNALSTLYSRLAPSSDEHSSEVQLTGEGDRKRKSGLR